MIAYRCLKCATNMASPDSLAGQAAKCPACGNVTAIPEPATLTAQPAPVHVAVAQPRGKKASGLGIAAFVLGLIACLIAWIPTLGLIAMPFAGIGLILAIIGIGLARGNRTTGKGLLIAGLVLCAVAIVLQVVWGALLAWASATINAAL